MPTKRSFSREENLKATLMAGAIIAAIIALLQLIL